MGIQLMPYVHNAILGTLAGVGPVIAVCTAGALVPVARLLRRARQ